MYSFTIIPSVLIFRLFYILIFSEHIFIYFLLFCSSICCFKVSFAFNAVTTFFPVLDSNSVMATLATLPPCSATFLFYSKLSGLVAVEISFVEASANIFKINSVLVILSLKFSFLSPFRTLYSLVVLPDQALEIISVSVAN